MHILNPIPYISLIFFINASFLPRNARLFDSNLEVENVILEFGGLAETVLANPHGDNVPAYAPINPP
ncbi:hypothetical protein LXL04_013092 [Taraxacum kok-saghyz]